MIRDKHIFIQSLKKHFLIGIVGAIFLGIGIFFEFLAYIIVPLDAKIFSVVFGLIFGIVGIWLLHSLISSIQYYYEKGMIKKYGEFSEANITNISREINDTNRDNNNNVLHEICIIEYEYRFEGKNFIGSDVCDKKEYFSSFYIGQKIPIQVYSLKPSQSVFRQQKYKNNLTTTRTGKS